MFSDWSSAPSGAAVRVPPPSSAAAAAASAPSSAAAAAGAPVALVASLPAAARPKVGSMSKMSAMEPLRLAANNREREQYDNMADLFAIIRTTEALEKAYVRDAITADDYKAHCAKLITQFKAAQNLCKETVPDVRKFMLDFRLDNCKAAVKRLVEEGVPLAGGKVDDSARTIAEVVQLWITAMDCLKLNQSAVDQLHPLLSDLLDSLSRVSTLPPDWEPRRKLHAWLVTMNAMKASDELSADQMRQLLFELEAAYNQFHRSLSPAGR